MDGGILLPIRWGVKKRFRSDKRGPGARLGREEKRSGKDGGVVPVLCLRYSLATKNKRYDPLFYAWLN